MTHPPIPASERLRRTLDGQESTDPVLLAAWAKGTLAELDEVAAKYETERVRLRDAWNDLLNIRGILSPNGQPRRVPDGVEMVPNAAPAVQWLADSHRRLAEMLARAETQWAVQYIVNCGNEWKIPTPDEGVARDLVQHDQWFAEFGQPTNYTSRVISRLVGPWLPVQPPDDQPTAEAEHFSSGESATSWHTVRLFDGSDVFDASVVVHQYDVEHPAECHALPEGAACWFDRYMEQQPRDADWPTEVGTYRMRLETRITGGREEPDYGTSLQVEPVVADLGTFERLTGAPAQPEPDDDAAPRCDDEHELQRGDATWCTGERGHDGVHADDDGREWS